MPIKSGKKLVVKMIPLFSFLIILRVVFVLPALMEDQCPKGDICALAGQKINFSGEVVSIRAERMEKTFLEVQTEEVEGKKLAKSKVLLILPFADYDYFFSDKIKITGSLKKPSNAEDSTFSYPLYLQGKGIYSLMFFPEISEDFSAEKDKDRNYWQETYFQILKVREKVRSIVDSSLQEPDAAIVKAFIVGDQGLVTEKLRGAFSRIGIIHILSVSGAHVTLLIFILTWFFHRFSLGKIFQIIFVSGGVIFYLLLSGSPSCAIRSGIMGLFAFFAIAQGRSSSFKRIFWFSASLLLLFNPLFAVADIGFELSFLAIFGLAYVYPIFEKMFIWGKRGNFWKLIQVLALSLSVEMAVLPLVFYYFNFFSLVSPASNILLLPIFSVLIPLGFLIVIVGFLKIIFLNFFYFSFFVNFLGEIIEKITHFILLFTEKSALLIASLPFSFVPGKVKLGFILLYYFFFFLGVFILNYVVKKRIIPQKLAYFQSEEFLTEEKQKDYFLKITESYAFFKNQSNLFASNKAQAFGFLVSLFLLFFTFSYLYSSTRPASLTVLDVGQGDAILIHFPKYHLEILVDGGPGKRVLPALGEVLPFYDNKIEMVFLTHEHQDHIEGLISVFARFKVDYFFLPKSLNKKSSDLYKNLFKKVVENKTKILQKKRGEQIILQKKEEKILEMEILSPFYDYGEKGLNNLNNESLVLKVNHPKSILLTGDADQGLMKALIFKNKSNLSSEILKVPHHGSRTACFPEFLQLVNFKNALISVGKDNQFGHPSRMTVSKLRELGAEVRRTDLEGNVEINF